MNFQELLAGILHPLQTYKWELPADGCQKSPPELLSSAGPIDLMLGPDLELIYHILGFVLIQFVLINKVLASLFDGLVAIYPLLCLLYTSPSPRD